MTHIVPREYKNLDEEDLTKLAQDFGEKLTCPLCIGFYGPVGVGKSTFVRSLIQSLTSPNLTVPSPTFTIVQNYETRKGPLSHFDLYRIKHWEELLELDIEHYIHHAICCIEWPEKLGPLQPEKNFIKVIMNSSHGKIDLRDVSIRCF